MKKHSARFGTIMILTALTAFVAAGCTSRIPLYPAPSGSQTATITATGVISGINTSTVTVTSTPTLYSGTPTASPTITITGTQAVNTATRTPTPTATRTSTPAATSTATQIDNTATSTLTVTETEEVTATDTATVTATATVTGTPIATPIATTIGAVAQATVNLGTSDRFALLSNSDLTVIPFSDITGDVGISPGFRSNITGMLDGDGQVAAGYAIYAADDGDPATSMLIQAKTDALAAYNDAVNAGRGTATSISGNINGLTLAPGLYESLTSIEISPGGMVYLDGQGDSNAVFVIRSSTSITTESTSMVILTGSAQAKNIFWAAGSSITLGTNSVMKGTLIAGTSVSFLNQAQLEGRALIQGVSAGQISLSENIIVLP